MTFNEELFSQVINDKFFREFLDSRENSIRFNVSVISAVCSELVNRPDVKDDYQFMKECVGKILNQCSQILKLTEVYRNLTEAVDELPPEKEFIEINYFLNEFCTKCSASVEKVCRIECIPCEECTIITSERLLTFAMLICVRHAILRGTEKIEISFTNENDNCVIRLKFTGLCNENVNTVVSENITSDYADDIISTVIRKLGGKYSFDEFSAEFVLPAENGGMSMLSAPERQSGKFLFSIYNNILSDLCDKE